MSGFYARPRRPHGSANLAPISSAFWLGDRCVLGLAPTSHTWANLARTGELVVSLPSVEQVGAVDRLALFTGSDWCRRTRPDAATGTRATSSGSPPTVEGRVLRVHAHPDVLLDGHPNRIDPDRWRPLIMSFQHFYGLTERVRPSRLASIDEELYR